MNPTFWIIGALLLIIAAMLVFWPQGPEDLSGFEQREKIREAHISSLQQDYEKLKARLKADSVVYSTTIQTYKDKDKVQSREIARIKASRVVVQVRDSVPEIDSLILAYDSLLESKDSQLQIAEKYISDLQMDLKSVTANFEERIQLQSETIADQKEVIQDQRKQLRKARRVARATKVAAVLAFGLGLLVGL